MAKNKNLDYGVKVPRFETKIEKEMHEIISSIRYGEKLEIPVMNLSTLDEKIIKKAIQKSAKWNCIDLHIRWSNDKQYIKLGVE